MGEVGIILLMEEVVGGIKLNLAADREMDQGIKARPKPRKVDLLIEGGLGGVGIILLMEEVVGGIKLSLAADREIGRGIKVRIKLRKVDLPTRKGLRGEDRKP